MCEVMIERCPVCGKFPESSIDIYTDEYVVRCCSNKFISDNEAMAYSMWNRYAIKNRPKDSTELSGGHLW